MRPVVLECDVSHSGKKFHFSRTVGIERSFYESFDELSDLLKQLNAGNTVDLPLVVRFPAVRAWSSGFDAQRASPNTRFGGYIGWASPWLSQDLVIAWIRKYTYVQIQDGAPVLQLSAIRAALLKALPELADIDYNIRHEELRFTFKAPDERVVAYQHLSEGFRALVTLIVDIAWRAVVLNPHLEETAPSETRGIVLIDEVEQHLHPKWQRRFLGSLHAAFPKLQIIATTHSPQVIASADATWLRRLTGDSQPERVARAAGLDTNTVLTEIMDDASRPEKHQDMLRRLARLIDEEKPDEAWKLHDELATDLGEADVELVKARWALEMDDAPGHEQGAPGS